MRKDFIEKRDSCGNALSEEQINFFKNSKCRTPAGRLLVCYHGSPNKFYTFKKSKIGSTNDNGMYGPGFYFTDRKAIAKDFGSNGAENEMFIYSVYLNIKNPLIIDSKEKEKKLMDILNKNIDEALKKDGIKKSSTINLMNLKSPNFIKNFKKNFKEITKKYDGIIVYKFSKKDTIGNQYIIFEPNQVKLIDNEHPSLSKNMRENFPHIKKYINQKKDV